MTIVIVLSISIYTYISLKSLVVYQQYSDNGTIVDIGIPPTKIYNYILRTAFVVFVFTFSTLFIANYIQTSTSQDLYKMRSYIRSDDF